MSSGNCCEPSRHVELPAERLTSPRRAAVGLLRLYQLTVSPLLGSRCRFFPSCSSYAQEAIVRYGVWRGTWRGLGRILRCHPFHPGGYDPLT